MTGASEPLASVVVATRNRPRRLEALLDAIGAQRLADGEAIEVIVVDDGSAARTAEILAHRCAAQAEHDRARLHVIRHARPGGPGAARNAGWQCARGPLVAFTDDDCAPDPGWLQAGLRAHRADPSAIVQGRTLAERHVEAGGLLTRSVSVESLGPRYETCNVFYPRELLERLGGFEEGFGLRPGGEDTDLAWRAFALGRRAVFAPDAVVRHAVTDMGWVGTLRFAARWSETVRIFKRHPQLRRTLHRRLFWNVWHYLLLRSALVLALRRSPRALRAIVLARHALALRARARGLGSGASAIPFLALYDAVELFAIARGACRHRTLVL